MCKTYIYIDSMDALYYILLWYVQSLKGGCPIKMSALAPSTATTMQAANGCIFAAVVPLVNVSIDSEHVPPCIRPRLWVHMFYVNSGVAIVIWFSRNTIINI